ARRVGGLLATATHRDRGRARHAARPRADARGRAQPAGRGEGNVDTDARRGAQGRGARAGAQACRARALLACRGPRAARDGPGPGLGGGGGGGLVVKARRAGGAGPAEAGLASITASRGEETERLFVRDSPPLWSTALWAQPWTEVPARVHQSLRGYRDEIGQF